MRKLVFALVFAMGAFGVNGLSFADPPCPSGQHPSDVNHGGVANGNYVCVPNGGNNGGAGGAGGQGGDGGNANAWAHGTGLGFGYGVGEGGDATAYGGEAVQGQIGINTLNSTNDLSNRNANFGVNALDNTNDLSNSNSVENNTDVSNDSFSASGVFGSGNSRNLNFVEGSDSSVGNVLSAACPEGQERGRKRGRHVNDDNGCAPAVDVDASSQNTNSMQQGQVGVNEQGQAQENSDNTFQVVDESRTTYEAADIPVNSAATAIGGSCSNGVSLQTSRMGASIGTGSSVCDLLAVARGMAATGDLDGAKVVLDEAHKAARFRNVLSTIRGILTLGLL